MSRMFLVLLAVATAGEALAHPSTIPHDHPHGLSALPGVDLLVVAVVVLALAMIVVGKFLKRW